MLWIKEKSIKRKLPLKLPNVLCKQNHSFFEKGPYKSTSLTSQIRSLLWCFSPLFCLFFQITKYQISTDESPNELLKKLNRRSLFSVTLLLLSLSRHKTAHNRLSNNIVGMHSALHYAIVRDTVGELKLELELQLERLTDVCQSREG